MVTTFTPTLAKDSQLPRTYGLENKRGFSECQGFLPHYWLKLLASRRKYLENTAKAAV